MSIKSQLSVVVACLTIVMMTSNIVHAQDVKFHPVMNPANGQISYSIPLPKELRIDGNYGSPYNIISDFGVFTRKTKTQDFFYSNYTRQYMQPYQNMGGRIFAPPQPLSEFVQQNVAPNMKARGAQLIKTYAADDALGLMRKFEAGMPQTGSRRQLDVMASDWRMPNGTMVQLLHTLTLMSQQDAISWSVSEMWLEAPAQHFEFAKTALAFGLANAEVGQKNQAMLNSKLVNDLREGRIRHNKRMKEAQEIHEANMLRIKAEGSARSRESQGRLSMSDQDSEAINRALTDRTTITSPDGTHRIDVPNDGGDYYVSSQGEVIRSDDPNYNPYSDPDAPVRDWMRYDED